jgi:hydroxymethylpyrimidine/phosphomethylpyrimidine kinase
MPKKIERSSRNRVVPVALTIAGSDNSGGAGIQADLKTFTTLGVFGCSSVTCVVAENPLEVRSIHAIPAERVGEQIDTVTEVYPVGAAKTGMLFSAEIIRVVAKRWAKFKKKIPLVVDPVMVSSTGTPLLKSSAMHALKEELLPLATLITPNLDEGALLFGEPIQTLPAMREAAYALSKKYKTAVLLKGGHLGGDFATDVLALREDVFLFDSPFVRSLNTHGTGCTLSAAIAAYLAMGMDVEEAVKGGKAFLIRAVRRAVRVGALTQLNHLP